MKPKLLFIILSLLQTTIPEKIVIDVARADQLNVSEIAERVIAIPLKTGEAIPSGIDRVYLINDNIFILDVFKENGIVYSHVLKFDLSGNFKEQLGAKDPVSKEFMEILDMKVDETNKVIYLLYSDGYRTYDYNGNLLSFYNRNLKSFKPSGFEFVFQRQIWIAEYSFKNGIADYSFVHTDLYGQKKDTIKSWKVEQTKKGPIFHLLSLSIHLNKLYISFGIDNTIYEVSQDKLSPVYKVEFKNLTKLTFDIIPNQIIIGHYINNSYWLNGASYDFLYDTEKNKSYNIKCIMEAGIFVSGIKDNLYNTGYFKINPTNRDDYIYFIKKSQDIKGSKIYDPKQTNPIIFLVKLK